MKWSEWQSKRMPSHICRLFRSDGVSAFRLKQVSKSGSIVVGSHLNISKCQNFYSPTCQCTSNVYNFSAQLVREATCSNHQRTRTWKLYRIWSTCEASINITRWLFWFFIGWTFIHSMDVALFFFFLFRSVPYHQFHEHERFKHFAAKNVCVMHVDWLHN